MPSSRTIFRAHFFFWFPTCYLLVFLILIVLLAGVFGCAGIVACTMFSVLDFHLRLMLYLLLQSCIANDMPHPVSSIYTHVYAHVFITIISISRYLSIQSTLYLTLHLTLLNPN